MSVWDFHRDDVLLATGFRVSLCDINVLVKNISPCTQYAKMKNISQMPTKEEKKKVHKFSAHRQNGTEKTTAQKKWKVCVCVLWMNECEGWSDDVSGSAAMVVVIINIEASKWTKRYVWMVCVWKKTETEKCERKKNVNYSGHPTVSCSCVA